MHSFFLLFFSFSFLLVLLRFYRLISIPFFLFPRFMERFSLSLVGGNAEQKIQGDHWLWDTMLEEVVVGGGGRLASINLFPPAVQKFTSKLESISIQAKEKLSHDLYCTSTVLG